MMALICTSQVFSAHKIEVVTEYLSPFQVRNHDGTLGGFSTAIVHRLFSLTGHVADIRVLPWARAYRIGLKKPNVLIYSIAHTKPRDKKFIWLGKVKNERFFIWGMREKFSDEFTSLEQAKNYRISVSKGYNSAIFVKENNFNKINLTTRAKQNVGMLFKGRSEILLSSELVLASLVNTLQLDGDRLIKLFEVVELHHDLEIAFSLGSDPALVASFQAAFRQLETSGELTRLKKLWRIYDDNPDHKHQHTPPR
ncbi:MAG: ABC transporter substrate-binding protein [Psychrobium sp.]|nr:ABC transporter substrate-binding protein [Psychrobium sp.]